MENFHFTTSTLNAKKQQQQSVISFGDETDRKTDIPSPLFIRFSHSV
jgi:hypothetical protein